jgi:glutathione reductase (NADPH)
VRVHDTRATLEDPHTVRLADGGTFTAAHILVATGGHPVVPQIPYAELGLVSDDIFLMEELPRTMLIVGGGYIACEMACILSGMGVEVTQIYRGAPDPARLRRGGARGWWPNRSARGIDLHTGPTSCTWAARDATSTCRRARLLGAPRARRAAVGSRRRWGGEVFDAVLFATGGPNTGLGLGGRGSARRAALGGRFSQTRVPSVYAIGDVTGRLR